MRRPRQLILWFAAGVTWLTPGCSARSAPAAPAIPDPPSCHLVPGNGPVPDRITVALPGPVRAPELEYPSLGYADLVIRRHLHSAGEVDCNGESVPDSPDGLFRVAESRDSVLVLARAAGDRTPQAIEVRAVPRDGRDWLDAGIDVLVTDDPNTLEYAAAKPEFTVVPLPWNRTFRLRIPGAPVNRLQDGIPPPGFGESLAREAVRVEARAVPAGGAADSCLPVPPPPVSPARRNATIVFIRDDRTGQDLATRLVVLARSPGGEWLRDLLTAGAPRGSLSATGVPAEEFSRLLRRGEDAGYVFAELNGPDPVSCAALRSIGPADVTREPGVSIPLVQTRYRAAVRRGVGGVQVTRAGLLWLGGPP